jgi:hypothetical protein
MRAHAQRAGHMAGGGGEGGKGVMRYALSHAAVDTGGTNFLYRGVCVWGGGLGGGGWGETGWCERRRRRRRGGGETKKMIR